LDELKGEIKGKVEGDALVQGRVWLGEGAVVRGEAVVRGPVVIGEESIIEGPSFVGPYTSIGQGVVIRRGEIQNSILMDHCLIDVQDSLTDSIIGSHAEVTGDYKSKPKGKRLIIGERSIVNL
jgi:glucose-1-phosphate thymidylyltransferase